MSNVALPETGDPGREGDGQPTRIPAANAPTVAPRPGFYAWYFFILMFLINFINYADRWVFSALSDVLKQQFGFNDGQIGFLASAFLVVYTLVAFPLGYVADRLSRKVIVSVGVALWSVATMLTPLAGNFGGMTLVRALVGVGEGSYYPAGTPMLSAWFPPKRRATILSIWGVGAVVGAGIGFLLAGALAGGDWRLAFYITGGPGVLLAALVLLARNKVRNEADPVEDQTDARRSFLTKARAYLRIPTLRVILGMHALGFFALTSLTAFLTIYLGATYGPESSYGAASLSKGLVALLPGVLLLLGGLLGGLSGGFWANRASRKRSGARVLVSGLGFLYSMPFVVITLLAPYILRAIPAYSALAGKTQVSIGVAIFAVFGFGAAFFLNIYNGPSSAALQDVLPPTDRAAGGGLELTLAHLLGDIWAASAVGVLSVALGTALGGEQIGLALLLTCPLALTLSGIVGIWGSRFYAADVAVLGTPEEVVTGKRVA